MKRYVAYYHEESEYEQFDTTDEAVEWLKEQDCEDGISEGTADGRNYIAEIKLVSQFVVTDRKEDYDARGEEWPYGDCTEFGLLGYVEVAQRSQGDAELKPCPFCRSTDLEIEIGPACFVMCRNCNTMGPNGRSRLDCIRLWNERLLAKKPQVQLDADTQ